MSDKLRPAHVEEKMKRCEEILQYTFQDRQLLERCLTHSSVAKTRLDSNERLEFLGDAILGMVVCEMLFHHFPEEPEGELTRIKSSLVSRNTCANISTRLGLEHCLLLGKGLQIHDSVPSSIIAAVCESLIAGVYLDGGFQTAAELVQRMMEEELETITSESHLQNFKSLLQQIAQKKFNATPVYHLLDEKGPDHSKCFQISAVIANKVFPAAWGATKKEAEQHAASNAVAKLEGKEIPHMGE